MARITDTIQGTLHSLGQGMTNHRGGTTRSIVQIGNREISNLSYDSYLANFIEDSIGDDIELGVVRFHGCPVVVGARFADGSVRSSTGWLKFMLTVYLVFGVFTTFAAMGFAPLWILVALYVWFARKPVLGLLLARKFNPTIRPE